MLKNLTTFGLFCFFFGNNLVNYKLCRIFATASERNLEPTLMHKLISYLTEGA